MEKKKKPYRNFTRSEKAIVRAYVELMQKKGTGRITVTDIVDAADLNRSTFYAHFKSAEDVREKIHSDVINEVTDILGKSDYKNSLSDPYPLLRHVIDIIRTDEEMYKRLLCTEGAARFLKQLQDIVISQYLSDEIILPQISDREEFEMNLRLFTGGFISVLQDWAAGDIGIPLERVIEVMSDTIKSCVSIYSGI